MSSIEQAARSTVPLAAGRRGPRRQRWAWAGGAVLAAALLLFCYLRVAGATQVNSDGAGLVLEAQSILHGNVLLHGWQASDVTFYTTELPEYVLVTLFAGVRPEVVHICSALTYTLLVLLAACVARGRARGAAGAARALLAAVVILAPQPTGPTQVLLGGPDHVGSAVVVLVLSLLLDWAPRRWWVPAAAGLLLAWGIVGDQLIELAGAVPLCLACLLRALRVTRLWSRARSWRAVWFEAALAVAAAASVPAGLAASKLLVRWGGIQAGPVSYHLAPGQNLNPSAWGLAGRCLLALFGADFVPADFNGHATAGSVAFAAAHLIGVAAVGVAVLLALGRLIVPRRETAAGAPPDLAAPATPPARAGDLVAGTLVLAMIVNFAAFMVEIHINSIYSAHEIGPLAGLGAALAGRMLGGPLASAWRMARGRPDSAADAANHTGTERAPQPGAADAADSPVPPARPRAWARGRRGVLLPLLPVLAAGPVAYAVLLGIASTTSQAPPRNAGLASWLVRHHLREGLAPYWEGSSVTVDAGGATQVLALKKAALLPHAVVPDLEEADSRLVTAAGGDATFAIVSPGEDISGPLLTQMFGPAAARYRYGGFTILVWRGNLLPGLARSAAAENALETGAAAIPL